MKEPITFLAGLLEELAQWDAATMLAHDDRRENLRISMPRFLIDCLPQAFAMNHHYLYFYGNPTGVERLCGIQIIESTDMAITLYHVDYPLQKSDWMIKKIPLDSVRTTGERFEKFVIEIMKLPWFDRSKTPLN